MPNIKFSGAENDDQLYYNIANQQVVDMRTFLGKRFLIKDAPKKRQWKMTAQTKKILGYECRRATLKTDKQEAEAWYHFLRRYERGCKAALPRSKWSSNTAMPASHHTMVMLSLGQCSGAQP